MNDTQTKPESGSASPIADLSYRGYDGPLHSRAARWWTVALATVRIARAQKGFWIIASIAALPYLISAVTLFFQSGLPDQMREGPFGSPPVTERFGSVFYLCLEQQGLWLFILAIMVGAGSIAADNRANALLVYLSKPITKGDYVLGKWMGIFVMLLAVPLVPGLVFFIYCLLSYLKEGFLTNEPLLLVHMVLASAIPATVHASLMVGISAWSRTPRVAGAIYAGLYFVSTIVSNAVWLVQSRGDQNLGNLSRHMSISGVISGLSQNVYQITLRTPSFHRHRGLEQAALAAPSALLMAGLAALLIVGGIAAARARIRAVEVVKG